MFFVVDFTMTVWTTIGQLCLLRLQINENNNNVHKRYKLFRIPVKEPYTVYGNRAKVSSFSSARSNAVYITGGGVYIKNPWVLYRGDQIWRRDKTVILGRYIYGLL